MARVRGNTGVAVALVFFGCAFVITLVIAIIFYTKIEAAEIAKEDAIKDRQKYVTDGETGAASAYIANGKSAYAGWKDKYDALEQQLTGELGALNEIKKLEKALGEKDTEFNTYSAKAESAYKLKADEVAAKLAEIATLERELANGQREILALNAKLQDMQKQINTDIARTDSSAQERIGELTQQVGERDNTIREREAAILELKDRVAKLESERPKVPENNTTLPDGRVTSVFEDGGRDLFIDLGRSDGLVMGMTFEVFDPEPVIRLSGQGEPRGKATIEVYALRPESATCRVVRMTRGEQIDPGDPIVNIAYDPNMDITMFAFGYFDIERDGGPSDIERIQTLITKNGATVAKLTLDEEGIPVLTPDLDYIVLGAEPVLPAAPSDQDFDPEVIAAYQAKKAEVAAYFQIVEDAKRLRIPVLNQNRFLELEGYYTR